MTYGIHNIHKFHTLSTHFYLSRGLFANPQKYDSWPSEIRDELKLIIKKSIEYQRKLAVTEESIARATIESVGGFIYELNESEKKNFRDSLKGKFTIGISASHGTICLATYLKFIF